MKFGLIGYPLSHSFSPEYFSEKFLKEGIDAEYVLYPIKQIALLDTIIKDTKDLKGLNITIPYKQSCIHYINQLDPAAKAIGAVNCIKIEAGNTTGYNTDYIGFRDSLLPLLQPHHYKALVLGSGGASLAVQYALAQLGIACTVVSRSPGVNHITYAQVNKTCIAAHSLIINTTPLGMYPQAETYPNIPYEYLNGKHLLYDLVYNPEESLFLQKGRSQKAQTKNGLEMLHFQAEAAWEIWRTLK